MPLTKTNTGNPIRGRHVPSARERGDCQAVINQLTFADLGRGAGTLHESGVARLDMQGRTAAGDTNLQVQIGRQTVAAGVIAASVLATGDPINQRGARNATVSILNQSMDSGTIWTLTGTLP
jgi:hypothetical protein